QALSPRLIDSFALITGAMPAQYGLDTAGVIDITTRSGRVANGGAISLYGGSHDTIMPSIDYAGSTGATDYFLSASYRHDALGIDSVDGSSNPLHDKTDQEHLFGYVDHAIGDGDRISFLGGFSNQWFQIPNPRGLHPTLGYDVDGRTDYLSDDLDERQLERTGFGALSWLHNAGPLTWRTSLLARYSLLDYHPDITGELLFNGQAQRARRKDLNFGLQSEGSYQLSDAHTIRAGIVIQRDRATSDTTTYAFPVDAQGKQTGQPIAIADHGARTGWTYSVYLEDEWKPIEGVTVNFGGRFDRYTGYRSEQQFSPRMNMVWKPAEGTTFHAGYARYFSPPPFELVGGASVAQLAGTSAAAPGTLDTTPFAERQNYWDIGLEQRIGAFTFTLDGYYRRSRNLLDEGQFGAPIILTPFNYRYGRIQGIEASVNYVRGPWMAYANFAAAKATGKDIISSQFAFDPDELAYIRDHYIHLDHDQTYTASAGLSYSFRYGALAGTKLGGDMLYGSGLRRTAGAAPNGDHLPGYAQFNLTASHKFDRPGIEVRLDVVNLFDHKYEIRDGSGIGVGAPQYGPRRGIFVGITKDI
ncbi:MAG TPA: TonB-dependent receptor, partial [Sphingomonas sp.]|nr:TonB-dependent receptor [Sphingomonas sp.]